MAYLAEGPVTVEVDGRILMVLRASEIVQEAKNRVPAASNETRVASNEAREAVKQIVQETTGEASGETAEKAVASGQIVQESKPPEPIKPGSLEMYRSGYHKAGDHVLMWKNRKLVESIVPEMDADGQTIPGG